MSATKTTTKKTVSKKATSTASAPTLKAQVYAKDGAKKDTIQLPESVFACAWNADLVHDVVVSMQSNARAGTAHTKDRSEVRGGGKKPWKQKGTGRARHGSRRSPIWTGGGVTFGPTSEKNYTKKINKNARAKALASIFSKKYADGEVVLVDALALTAPKIAEAKGILTALAQIAGYDTLATKKANSALLVLPSRDESVERSFQNFGNVAITQAKDVNPVDLLTYKYIILATPTEILPVLEHRVAPKRARQNTNA